MPSLMDESYAALSALALGKSAAAKARLLIASEEWLHGSNHATPARCILSVPSAH